MSTLTDAYNTLPNLTADPLQLKALATFQHILDSLENDTPTRGLYIYGSVGRGKSMLMNLFFDHAPTPKRRVHFHAFMEDVHHMMHTLPAGSGDPMVYMAKKLRAEATLFCFDEFYITNIADAMLLGRLFEQLFKHGITVCATSNWAPNDLFQGGVNRHQFLPFIKCIETHMEPYCLNGDTDYRMKNGAELPYFIFPTTPQATKKLWKDTPTGKAKLKTPLPIPAKYHEGAKAWYTFAGLCGSAIGPDTYLDIARHLDTLLLENIPLLPPTQADAAIRFITLIDILYENKVKLVATAAVHPQQLCPDGAAAQPFLRTISRITEMQQWA